MTLIGFVAWALVLVGSIAYVFPGLALALAHYVAAMSYLALILAAPFLLVALALFLWARRRRSV